ncbi:MAG: MBL fold metallo-hydrolase [Rubrivivax sp.]|nr:MBL fold metallo-hydrolase [Pyrinomonadaceae bacterium]
MKRFVALLALFSLFATTAAHPRGHGHSSAQNDFSKVEIKTLKVAGNVYMLEGAGGNIGVIAGAEGILIVDDQYAPLAEKIRAALSAINPGKLRFVLNTHWHFDHTGGNAQFGTDSVIVAHSNVLKRLATGATIRGNVIPPAPKVALPLVTYDNVIYFHFGGEEIRVVHYPAGHTDGDSVVFFTGSNVIHMGDDFFVARFPFVDLESGGNVEGLIQNIGDIIAKAPAGVKIIPGHGPISTIEDLKTYHITLGETMNIVRQRIRQGKTLEQAKAEGLPEKYKEWGTGFIKTDQWIETIYRSLKQNEGKKPGKGKRASAMPRTRERFAQMFPRSLIEFKFDPLVG